MRRKPSLDVMFAIVAAIAVVAVVTSAPRVSAQNATPVPVATPVTSPIAGSVPCTTLFGIVSGNACLLALNGSHDAGPLDLYVDGSFLVPGVTFGTLGDFVPVAAGQHQFQFVPSGAPLTSAVITTRVNLREGVAYQLAALGPIAQRHSELLPVDTRPLPAQTARIRLVQGADDVSAVDLAITGGVPIIADLRRGAISDVITVPAGTYALEVRRAGTDNVILPLPGIVLNPNTSYTLYLIGSQAQGSLGVVLVPVLVPPETAASATPIA